MIEKKEWLKLSDESKWNLFNGKEDTRDDCSNICYYNEGYRCIIYINPNNKKQVMYVDNYGFNVTFFSENFKSGKDLNQKLVWQKIESITELKKGDLVRFWDDEDDKNCNNYKCIITAIKNDIIFSQVWDDILVPVTSRRNYFDNWENVEKAVIVEE